MGNLGKHFSLAPEEAYLALLRFISCASYLGYPFC
jgi:hypothetical protein